MHRTLRAYAARVRRSSPFVAALGFGLLVASSGHEAWAQDKSGTKAGLVKLPAAGGTVTAEGSTFVVQGNSGAANYTIPLPELPGRAGVAPALMLTYNQMNGDPASGFGSGWRVDVPSIEVSSESGIPWDTAFGDATNGPTNDNTFRLHGQRLYPDPSQWGNGVWQYRLQTSDQEVKVRYHALPYSVKWGHAVDGVVPAIPWGFEVIYPDGKVDLYSGDPNVAEGDGTLVTKFPLVYEVYRQGEAIAYKYVKSANKSYLQEVAFASGLSRYTFDLMQSTPNVHSYKEGFPQTNGRLVQQLVASYGGQVRNRWCFVYEGPTAGSGGVVTAPACSAMVPQERAAVTGDAPVHDRLVSILRYGNTTGITPASLHNPRMHFEYSSWNAQDLATRALVYPAPSMKVPQIEATNFELLDANRDGLPDILKAGDNAASTLFFGNASLDDMFKTQADLLLSRDGFQVVPDLRTNDFQVADINGDSFADLLQLVPGSIYFFDGSNEHAEPFQWRPPPPDEGGFPFDVTTFEGGAAQFVDLNQDGLSDVITTAPNDQGVLQWLVYLNFTRVDASGHWAVNFQPASFTLPHAPPSTAPLTDTRSFKIVDVNADGLPDLTWTQASGGFMCVYENTGVFMNNSQQPSTLLFGRPELNDTDCGHGVRVTLNIPQFAQTLESWILDVNGDGIKDLVSMGKTTKELLVWYGQGDLRFAPAVPVALNADLSPGDVSRSRVADIDGDGQEEVIVFQPLATSSQVVILDFNRTPTTQLIKSGLLTSAEIEGGDRHDIRYATSTDEVARDRNLSLSPNALHFPAIVAKQVVRSSGKHGDHAWTDVDVAEYFYHDPYYDPASREFRGFREVDKLLYGDEYLPVPTQESAYIEETYATYDPDPVQRQLAGQQLTRRVSSVKTAPILLKLSDSNTFDPNDPLLHSLSTSTQAQQLVQGSRLLQDTTNTWKLVEQVPNSGTYFAQLTASTMNDYGVASTGKKTTTRNVSYDGFSVAKSEHETSSWTGAPLGITIPSYEKLTQRDYTQSRTDLAQFLAVSLPSEETTTVNGVPVAHVRTEYDREKGLATTTHKTVYGSAPPLDLIERAAGTDTALATRLQGLAVAQREVVSTLGYDDFGNPTSHSDSVGLGETVRYDDAGVMPLEYHKVNLDDTSLDQVTMMFYQTDGQLQSYENPLHLTATLHYDELGRRDHLTYDDGGEEQYDYRLAEDSLPGMILTTTRRYKVGANVPAGESATVQRLKAYRIDGVELGELENAENGGVRVLGYHKYNRKKNHVFSWTPYIASTLNGQARINLTNVFSLGTVPTPAQADDPDSVGTELRYDPLDRLSFEHLPDGKARTTQYEAWGKVTTETFAQPSGQASRATYEVSCPLGLLAKAETGNGQQVLTRFGRDAFGQLTSIQLDGEPSPRLFAFDSNGKQLHQKIPGVAELYVIVDPRGRPVARIDVSNDGERTAVTEFGYDSLDRPTTRSENGHLVEEQSYDRYPTPYQPTGTLETPIPAPIGQLTGTRVYDPNLLHDFEEKLGYNSRGSLVNRTVQLGQRTFSENSAYTLDGATVTQVSPRGLRADMSLNLASRLNKVTVSGSSFTQPVAVLEGVTYNAKNLIAGVSYRKGAQTAIDYDPSTLLVRHIASSYHDADDAVQPLQDLSYALDGDEKITGITDNIKTSVFGSVDRTASFQYDWRGELTQAQRYKSTHAYTYTKTGQFITNDELPGTWHVRSDTTLLAPGTDTNAFTYNPFGQLASSPEIAETRYNAFGQLLYVRTKAGQQITYGYGVRGKRTYKHVVAADGTVRESLFPAPSYIEEPSGAQSFISVGSKRLVRFDHGHAAEPDRWFYYLEDHIGSNDILMSSEGLPVEQNLYFPFGSEAKASDLSGAWNSFIAANAPQLAAEKTHHRFTGKYLDDETGLYDYGARYYHPKLGRFITADPLVIAEPERCEQVPLECNLYGYGRNNPVSFVDETGFWSSKFIPNPFDPFRPIAEPVHQMAIAKVFLGTDMPLRDIFRLQGVQTEVDEKENQTPAKQYMHSMAGEGMDRAKAIEDTERLLHMDLQTGQSENHTVQSQWDHQGYLNQLGEAIHALQDATSPSHRGFQEYHGDSITGVIGHVIQENTYPLMFSQDRKNLEGATRWAYDIKTGKAPMPDRFFDQKTGELLLPDAYKK